MKNEYIKKEPIFSWSVLFFIMILVGITLGWLYMLKTCEETDMVPIIADYNIIRLIIQAFLLHSMFFWIIVYRNYSSFFYLKIKIIIVLVGLLCGINIGRLAAVNGLTGFSAGLVSYFPHYIVLFILYKNYFQKYCYGHIFQKTDYIKYVMILIVVSFVHILLSRSLSNLII